MRLIDAEELERLFNEQIEQGVGVIGAFDAFYDALQDAPTVDAVPVVRCKECKHYDMGVCLKIYSDGNVHSAARQKRKPDDFCSYGERGMLICTCPNELECPVIGSDVVCLPWCEYLEDGGGEDG